MKSERNDLVMAAEVIGICNRNEFMSLDKITYRIYKNNNSKNKFKVFLVVEALMKHNVLVPQLREGIMCFRYNNGTK